MKREADRCVGRYAWYALGVLLLVYTINFIDRQVLGILAQDIKRDLGVSDADLGFLYGTAFGVFYALFGIPFGRLADHWHRVRLMTLGLMLWSFMTALSGMARSGASLAVARIGVGVGEATASPCAYSLISDYFPKRLRSTALSIYSAGVYLGAGLSLYIGGAVVLNWNRTFGAHGPFGLAGWQAAFLAVGLPGLLLAIWVASLREPLRGQSEGIITPPSRQPFHAFFMELMTTLPPLTLIAAARLGRNALLINLAGLMGIAVIATMLIRVSGDSAQWIAMGIGSYAIYSWAMALRDRDSPLFRLTIGSPTFLCIIVGYGLNNFIKYSISFWASPYALRAFASPADSTGLFVGGAGAVGGFLGVIAGGRVADYWRERNPSGHVGVMLFASCTPVLPILIAFSTRSQTLFYAMLLLAQALGSCALGAAAASIQDLVLPRMRGTATAVFFVGSTMLGLALGPYVTGKISSVTGNLSLGVFALLLSVPLAFALLLRAYKHFPEVEARRIERAQAAGES